MALLYWQIMEREIFFKEGQQKKSKNDSLYCKKKKQAQEILTLLSKSYIKLWFFFTDMGRMYD